MRLSERVSKYDLIYYVGFVLNFYIVFMQITLQIIPCSQLVILACLCLFSIVILNTKFPKKEIVFWGMIILFMLLFYVYRNDSNPLRIALMIMASRNIDKNMFLLFYRILLLSSLLIALFFVLKGYRFLYVDDYWGLGRGYERRYLFGFDGPNRVNTIFLAVLLSTICSRYKKRKQIIFLILLCLVFAFTKSRTGLLAGVIFIIYPYTEKLIRKIDTNHFAVKIIPYVMLGVVLLVTLIACIGTQSESLDRWNTIFNNRFVNLSKAKELFEITPLGIDIPEDSVGGLDNSYFLSFYSWGYLLYTLYIGLVIRLIKVLNLSDNCRGRGALITYIILPFVIELIHLSSINGIYILAIVYYKEVFGAENYGCHRKNKILENDKGNIKNSS